MSLIAFHAHTRRLVAALLAIFLAALLALFAMDAARRRRATPASITSRPGLP